MSSRVSLALVSLVLAARSLQPVCTSQLYIRPIQPMVATRIERPLYVVLDPAVVPDRYDSPQVMASTYAAALDHLLARSASPR